MIKVIIMDIDGTLTNKQKEITPITKQVLIEAQNNGIKLVLASGRPTSGLMKYAKELEMDQHHGLLVCFNGSKVVDCSNNEVLYNQAMTKEEAKEILAHLRSFNVRAMVDYGEYMYIHDVFDNFITYKGEPFNIMKYEARSNNYKLCEVDDLSDFIDFPVNKILTYSEPEYLQAHYKEMSEPFIGRINCMFTADYYYEYTANGIDKAKALDTVLIPMGYSKDEMIAFGDAQNDKTMIEYVGIGVAMGNATDELKSVANIVTLSNEEDGIAHTLRQYL